MTTSQRAEEWLANPVRLLSQRTGAELQNGRGYGLRQALGHSKPGRRKKLDVIGMFRHP